MESENNLSLNEDQWRVMDRIAEALSAGADLAEGLQAGLELLLDALERPGAALYLPRCCEHFPQDWIFYNTPPAWQGILASDETPVRHEIERLLETGVIAPGDAERGYAAIFPILGANRILGALLVDGPIIAPRDYPLWQALLRPFGRIALIHEQISGVDASGVSSYLELMRSRNILRALFDNLPISIYIVDASYRLAAINMSRANRTPEGPKQLVGRPCYEALYQREAPCPGCRVAETFAQGEKTMRLNRNWLDADRFVEWEIHSYPILDEKEAVRQAILVEQDITNQRNLEANLVQSEKLAAVGQLAAGVAHEINNPLTAILANTQILKRDIPTNLAQAADLLDSLDLIEMAGTRALQVVRNLLGIARKEKYEYEPVNVNETLRSALTLTQHELVGRSMHLEMDLDENLPELIASQDQLQGVWINLMLNAIDAIDKPDGQIQVATRFTGSEIQVAFTDNGRGIPEEHLPHLFEPFFTTKNPGNGTGLGLSVCLRTVRHYNGDIRVESVLGAWTRFTVTLPVQ